MAKDKISDYSSTANSNTDIAGINIDEGCAPSGINDAIRTLMAQLKTWQSGGQDIYIHPAGTASAPSITANGDTNTGIFFPAADTVGITTGGTERARVDSSGNLGLGVTPSAWSGFKAFQLGSSNGGGYIAQFTSTNDVHVGANNYYNGSNFIYSATDFATRYRQVSGQHQWHIAASGSAGGTVSFTQAMTLDASGNLGIGTSSPSNQVHVYKNAASAAQITIENASTSAGSYGTLQFSAGTVTSQLFSDAAAGVYAAGAVLRTTSNHPLIFGTNGSERARIASGGQFCVNTTNTNGAFNVSGNVYLFSQTSGAGNSTLKWNSGTGQVTYDTSSRLVKDNIVDSPYGLAEVLQLKSRKYFRTDDQREEIGLVADEVQAVLPEFVPMSPKSIFTGDEADTELVPSGVYYEKLSSVLIKAIQELKAEFDAYKASHP